MKIILVSGDPNSINSEIIYKCWKKLPRKVRKKFLISNYQLIKDQFKKLNYNLNIVKVSNIFDGDNSSKLKILY